MAQKPTIKWPGQSGAEYVYFIYSRGAEFAEGQPGNYIHVIQIEPNRYRPVYIGQTSDLNERLTNHERQQCVDAQGATHLCVHKNTAGDEARLAEEKDLILRWQPPCNTHYCD